MSAAVIPCTRFTRNNPGCRCVRCLERREALKRKNRDAAALARAAKTVSKAIARIRAQDGRKRARPWEGVGRRD